MTTGSPASVIHTRLHQAQSPDSGLAWEGWALLHLRASLIFLSVFVAEVQGTITLAKN